jgi:UDP-N-acetylmuramyl pentapeptide synthase
MIAKATCLDDSDRLFYNNSMSYKVFLNKDSVIEIDIVGDQNLASVELMGRQVDTLLTQQKAVGKPALVLDNVVEIGKVDAEARKLVVELAKRLDYDRLAMLGKGGIMRFGANLMLRATGRTYKIRYFDDRDKAIEWLMAPKQS